MSDTARSEIERMEIMAARLIAEAEGLLGLLPLVGEAQWDPAPANRVEAEVKVVNASGAVDDPVGNAVADPMRLALREQVVRSEALLKDALVKAAGVRRGLEIRMARWEGNP